MSFRPGSELIALCQLEVNEDLFLRHHTFGGPVSLTDDGLTALPVMPLTMSMEMLAEAAAAVVPGLPLIGMERVRAYRWIALDEGRTRLRLSARRTAAADGSEVEVRLHQADDGDGEAVPEVLLMEAIVRFGAAYPEPPEGGIWKLQAARPSRWTPDTLYTEGMFHGPSWRGVVSVDRWGRDGAEATLLSLPTDGFFRKSKDPWFLIDPVLMDTAGQLIGFWAAEHLDTGFNVFPFSLEALRIYGPNLDAGRQASCRARIALVGDQEMQSDIDVVGADGRLRIQLLGWQDRRFELPDNFYKFRVSPRDARLARPWPAPIRTLAQADALACCLLDTLSGSLLEAHDRIWQRVLAHLVLSRGERIRWQELSGTQRRRVNWLLGRAAAKDAVRLFLADRYGVELCPADVEIFQDRHGRPLAGGAGPTAWRRSRSCR